MRRDEIQRLKAIHMPYLCICSQTHIRKPMYIADSSRMRKIGWLIYFGGNSNSLFKYQCFRYVLVFDSTYKTNVYTKPLVLFVSVNNHRATCVFGTALLSDETVQSYTWVLNTFMESMSHKYPLSLLIDGDKAMRNSIDELFPNSRHLIYG
ncbi:hypothetical protein Dsin_002273 [Dipteronia sinensis]|uniref:MULE transposase domain-containing protein n=1 Tax=Dipteronia sinensis TaxID=43782 RepID=A0AAE0EJT6_9ROSI|nr:hypothetical protein Dsin_002273 [Dipteronia sinensis]